MTPSMLAVDKNSFLEHCHFIIRFFTFLSLLLTGVIVQGQSESNTTLLGRWNKGDGPSLAVAASNKVAFFGNGQFLEIVDFTDPSNPDDLGRIQLPDTVQHVFLHENMAYLACESAGLRSIDISDLTNPIEVGALVTPGDAQAVVVSEAVVQQKRAYLAAGEEGLRIIDVSDPSDPVELSFWNSSEGFARGVAVAGSSSPIVYLADEHKIRLILGSISGPYEVSFHSSGFSLTANDLVVSGDKLYVAFGRIAMMIVDVFDSVNPFPISHMPEGYGEGIDVVDNLSFVATSDIGLRVIDVSSPDTPTLVGFFGGIPNAMDVAVEENIAYVASASEGLFVVRNDFTTSIDERQTIPKRFALLGNYPNPFNPSTEIAFELPTSAHIHLAIYNLLGQQIRILVDALRPAGNQIVLWDGLDDGGEAVSTGIYLYRMEVGSIIRSKKMLLLK